MAQTKTRPSRRNFLIVAGAGGAASAAALVVKPGNEPAAASSGEGKRSGVGYKVSEHINNYYRTAKV